VLKLINNAKKFTKKGGKIKITAKLEDNMIKFSVKDNGIGVKESDQARLFEPFFQAEQTIYREHQGTGLGLAICKGIVESQNGKLWLDSIEGEGVTFYFTVPLKPVRASKSIKLLFSPKSQVEKQVRDLLITYIGPMADTEFTYMKGQGLTYEKVTEQIENYNKKGIIDENSLTNIKRELTNIYEIKEKTGDINVPKEVKDLFLVSLGPLGAQSFQELKDEGLTSEKIKSYIMMLQQKGIVTESVSSLMTQRINSLYKVKEVVNVPEDIKKLYISILGPMGKIQFDELKSLTTSVVIGNINQIENAGVIKAIEASRFRDSAIRILRKQKSNI